MTIFKPSQKILFASIIFFIYSCSGLKETVNNVETDNSEEDNLKANMPMIIKPPVAPKEAKTMEIHGDNRIDNYYWMRLTDDQKNAEEPDVHTSKVLNYLNAENEYREKSLSHLDSFEDKLYEEIIGRIKQTDLSVPYQYNGYYYLTKYDEGKEYAVYTRKKESLDAAEEMLLDVNELAAPYDYYSVGGRAVSPNNKMLAYGEDTLSRRIYTVRFKDLVTGEMMGDVLEGTSGGATWANDNKTLYYTKKDPVTLRSDKIYRHKLGTDQKEDVLIFEEDDDTFYTAVFKSKSEDYIMIISGHTLTTEYQYLNANDPEGQFKTFIPRDIENEHEYYLSHYDDHWYIRSNHEAPNFKLMKTKLDKTAQENWEEVIAHRPEVFLQGVDIFKDFLVLSERVEGIREIRVRPWDGSAEHYIQFDEAAHTSYTTTNLEFDTDILRIGYQSMKTPNTLYDYNMNSRTKTLLKQSEVVGDFSSDDYITERINIKARDGVDIPISIVYHKNVKVDGSAPCLLYAYGSYGSSMDPTFRSSRLSLLDRGFVYAIAHIRGGQELGKQWYDNGKLLKKKNSFTDFIDCGKALKDKGYSADNQLYAMGGSAGGLLMGAIVNMEPKLWAGVIAAVPFVDVITTMLDETIPLTTFEFDEWGNPKKKEYYDYMLSYSPYDNVKRMTYPPMLVTTGLFDSQVQYWEPAKWVAKLREYKTGDNPLYLYCNMDTGHGGASGRFQRQKETAKEYAFLLDLANKSDVHLNSSGANSEE